MVARIADAAAAYANAATRGTGPGLEARDQPDHGAFASMVRDTLGAAVEAGRAGDGMTAQALAGRADLNDVVLAVNNAELTLQMVVGIRDRVIQAYQEIIRMPI